LRRGGERATFFVKVLDGPLMSLIDQLLPIYQFSERHSCRVAADPAMVLEAVATYRPEDDRFFRLMIGLRELPMRLLSKADRIREPFGLHNFTLLARTDEAIVYGLIGKFWRLNYGLTPVAGGEAFRSFSENGVAKLALGFSAQNGSGQTELMTETRVHCPDRMSRRSFTPYWILIRPVSGLIRRRILNSVKHRSERSLSAIRLP
jgi:hypothetical protein